MKICSVIVTYNRISDLKKCISSYENQIENVDTIILVDNNSTDGTREFLKKWELEKSKFNKKVIYLKDNIGGSGGFYEGLKYAAEHEFDWIFIHDDDAFVLEDTIKKLKEKIEQTKDMELSAICGEVIEDNQIAIGHRKRIIQGKVKVCYKDVPLEEYNQDYFELNSVSYVGVAINVNKLKLAGLPNKDFFIYCDDVEHGYRLSKVGKIICFPEIKIIHSFKKPSGSTNISWKTYYGLRNNAYFLKKHFKRISYWYYILREKYHAIKKSKVYRRLSKEAIKDGIHGKLGIHQIYKPGWIPESEK